MKKGTSLPGWKSTLAAAVLGLVGGGIICDRIEQSRIARESQNAVYSTNEGTAYLALDVETTRAEPAYQEPSKPQVQESQAPIEKIVDYSTKDFSADSEQVSLARMLFGEARNCSDEEMYAVAYSAINRSHDGKKWNGEGSVTSVVHKPWQYSCFNDNDPNKAKLMNPEEYDSKSWQRALYIASNALEGQRSDLNKGQTHYFNPQAANPSWAKKLEQICFDDYKFAHEFRRE